MDDTHNESSLLLPDLYIENFRGIKKLSIPRLGRVTLFAGRNGVGKTTVLDAIRVYAARGRHQVLAHVLDIRDEITTSKDPSEDGPVQVDWAALFHGRSISEQASLSIGPREKSDQLSIKVTILDYEHPALSICRVNSSNVFQETGFEHSRLIARGTVISSFHLVYGGSLPGVTELLPRD